MPRDRFAGLRSLSNIGQITLKPLEIGPRRELTINADASRGAVYPELLDVEGHRVRGFSKEDAVRVTGDSLRHPVRWNRVDPRDIQSGRYMLRLHLVHDVDVYAAYVSAPK